MNSDNVPSKSLLFLIPLEVPQQFSVPLSFNLIQIHIKIHSKQKRRQRTKRLTKINKTQTTITINNIINPPISTRLLLSSHQVLITNYRHRHCTLTGTQRSRRCLRWARSRMLSTMKSQRLIKSRYIFYHSQITCAIHLSSKPNSLLTIGQDGFLKIFDVYEKTCIKSFKICDFVLSSIAMLKQD